MGLPPEGPPPGLGEAIGKAWLAPAGRAPGPIEALEFADFPAPFWPCGPGDVEGEGLEGGRRVAIDTMIGY